MWWSNNRWRIVNIRSIGDFSGEFMGATMQSGAGYGLYVVLLAGALAMAGGLLGGEMVLNKELLRRMQVKERASRGKKCRKNNNS